MAHGEPARTKGEAIFEALRKMSMGPDHSSFSTEQLPQDDGLHRLEGQILAVCQQPRDRSVVSGKKELVGRRLSHSDTEDSPEVARVGFPAAATSEEVDQAEPGLSLEREREEMVV